MAKKLLLGIDFGTTGTKAVIYDIDGNEIGQQYFNTSMDFPRPGWVSQNPQEIIDKTFLAVQGALKNTGVNPSDIAAMAITHICTTFVPVDKDDNFLYGLLSWQDLRGADMFPYMRQCWEKAGLSEMDVYAISGSPLGTLPTLSKVLWLRENEPEIWKKTHKILGMQAMLNHAFTGEGYYDDRPGITQSMLADADTLEFSPKLAALYDIDLDLYPKRLDAGSFIGTVGKDAAAKTGLYAGTPIYMAAGDCRCAPLGAGVISKDMLSLTIGTVGVFHAFASKSPRHKDGQLQVLGHAVPGNWQFEAFTSAAASSLEWFKEKFCQLEAANAQLMGISVFEALTALAENSPIGAKGLLYSPWLAGADCMRNDPDARTTITGLTFSHDKGDVIRAIMEGVCLEMKFLMESLEDATGEHAKIVRSTGGGSKSDLWNQIQADMYDRIIETVHTSEATSLGAVICAAVGLGEYKDIREASSVMVKVKKRFEPIAANTAVYKDLFGIYQEMYDALSPKVFPELSAMQDQYS